MMCQWYVVKTKPHQERRASLNLRNQNFKVISPFIKKKNNCEPLFPTYIFVSFDINKDFWPKINNSYGVSRLLSFSGIPKQLDNNFICHLKQILDKDGFVKKNFFNLKTNVNVKINDGPFKGFFASVIKKVSNERVKLMIDFFQGKTTIIVNIDNLLPA
tara:strand:- start:224 stop:700 length:477 start_codon:yes stop_codon:yes gene_type:complete